MVRDSTRSSGPLAVVKCTVNRGESSAKETVLLLNLPEYSACENWHPALGVEGSAWCCCSLFQKSISDRQDAPVCRSCTNRSALPPGGVKQRAQNKVYEEGSWAASLWVGERVWPHISSKVIALRLEPRCDNTLCGQGISHNLKNNSFPSFPNRGEGHSLKDQRVKYLLWCRIFLFCLKLQQEPVSCINKTVTVSQGRVTFLSPMGGTVI